MAESSSQSNTQKLNEILRRLEGGPEASLHNIEVVTEKILGDVTEIKAEVKKLKMVVVEGNGEPSLKEQVHHLRRDVTANTDELKCHLEDDKKRVDKTHTLWEKVGFEFLRILPGLLLAYLLITFGWK